MARLRHFFSQHVVLRFVDSSLRTKMMIMFLSIALLPIAILAYGNYWATRSALIRSANQTLWAAGSETVTQIDNFLNTTRELVENIARLPDVEAYPQRAPEIREGSALEKRLLKYFFALQDKTFYSSTISSSAILDASGRNILDSLPTNVGNDESDRLYFRMAVDARQAYISPLEFPRRGSVAFYFSCPIYQDLDITGVLRIRYNAVVLQQLVAQRTGLAGAQSYAMLLNEHSVILAHDAAPELLFKTAIHMDPERVTELQAAHAFPRRPLSELWLNAPTFERGLQQAVNQPFFAAYTRPDVLQQEQVAVVKLRLQPGSVAFVQPQSVFLTPVRTQTMIMLGLAVLIAGLMIAGAISVIHVLTRPIAQLTRSAEQIAAGNISESVPPVRANDEIGKLSGAFQNMTVQLRQTLQGLEDRNQRLKEEVAERKRAETELREHRDQLEDIVKTRTSDLTQSNQQLSQEILERTRIEEQLKDATNAALEAQRVAEDAQKAAETANQAKSMFLSNMSHELRTPLNGILGYAQILNRNPDLARFTQAREGLEVIEMSGTHLLRLINDLLDLSKIESLNMELYPVPFSLSECLNMLIRIIRIRAQKKGVQFHVDLDADLPDVVNGDEKRLSQILLNLLGNAIKFTDTGSVRFEVKRDTSPVKHTEHPSRITLHFSVSDTGPGIPEESLDDIFSAFVQVGHHQQKAKGTGLGLAISQTLVRLMGGELRVKSAVGRGSVFWFEISLREVIASSESNFHDLPRIVGFKGEQRKILVVDDSPENRGFLLNLLRPLGFAVMEASDGREALEKVQQWTPELILLDLVMPIMDGFAVMRQLRGELKLPQIKIIVVTASVTISDQQLLADTGCDAVVAKPIQVEVLLERIRQQLEIQWVHEETSAQSHIAEIHMPDKIPSPYILTQLRECAERGYITDIRKMVSTLREEDGDCRSFADVIENLANTFQFDRILELVHQSLQKST